MHFDTRTIFVMAVAMCLPIAGLLFLSWWQNRAERTLLWWSGGFFVSAIGLALFVPRGRVSDLLSVDLANTLVILGIVMGWAGARAFDGRRTPLWAVALAPALWLAACRVPAIYEQLSERTVVFSLIYMTSAAAVAVEYWRGRADGLVSRYILVATFAVLSLTYAARVVLVASLPPLRPEDYLQASTAMGLFVMVPVVLAVASAVLVVATTKDRAEAAQRRLAETDPLTGMPNRGATLDRAAALLAAGPGAMLLFDLDRFKRINDRFGHPAGDLVLREFSIRAGRQFRGTDVFGRIGGEEFLAFLPGAGRDEAMRVAERIRTLFADTRIEKDGAMIPATVSIGIAVAEAACGDMDRLLIEADRALYAAKEMGRDRVQFFMPRAA